MTCQIPRSFSNANTEAPLEMSCRLSSLQRPNIAHVEARIVAEPPQKLWFRIINPLFFRAHFSMPSKINSDYMSSQVTIWLFNSSPWKIPTINGGF